MSDPTHLNRRQFLTIVGATGGIAACSPAHGTDKLIPLLNPPEDGTPGQPTFYRTVCRECPAGCGVTARTREGRVVKLEGNPDHPINKGALCARGQAAIQGLYDPDRPRGPLRRNFQGQFEPAGWEQALDEISGAMRLPLKGGEVVLLCRSESGSQGSLQQAFARAAGDTAERLVYEPFAPIALRTASEQAFGVDEVPVYRIDRAGLILSLGADFLETWLSPVEHARMLSEARSSPQGRAQLVFVGPQLTLTAANADEWLAAAPGAEREIALALCNVVLTRGHRGAVPLEGVSALAEILGPYTPAAVEKRAGLPAGTLERLGGRLLEARSSIVLPPAPVASGADATRAALAVTLLNQLLGNHGSTVLYGLDPIIDRPAGLEDLRALTARMAAGKVKVLITLGADPVATLPAELGFAEAMEKVPLTVCISTQRTATSEKATYLLPEHHPLESFSENHVRAGVLGIGQPAMRPVFDSRSSGDILLELGARLGLAAAVFPFKSFEEYWRDRVADYAMLEEGHTGDLLAAVRDGQQHGGFFSERPATDVVWQPGALEALRTQQPVELKGEAAWPTLILAPDSLRYDGRSADKPWLQEIGDPMTTVAWATPLCMSAERAAQLGLLEGDVVRLTIGKASAELPVYLSRGLSPGVVSASAGSPEVLRLLPALADPIGGGQAFLTSRVQLTPTGRHVDLAKHEGLGSLSATDELVRKVATLDAVLPVEHKRLTLYPEAKAGKHRWGMAIDLDRCTGCEACVTACYAENNIPTVGAEQINRGRAMGWLRMERYFTPEAVPAKASFLPMLCQQCGDAPCETVCPVEATYHSPEGLNAQVYNRCVGTRYCANNCPYKARVFNYSDHDWPEPVPMRLNPDVTVREKGVMEKCTFCVQRIRLGENQARDAGRPVRDGDIVPACAQTCPAQAITFGDLQDQGTAVYQASKRPRGYHVLEDQNTAPAVTYLARVDPGAAKGEPSVEEGGAR